MPPRNIPIQPMPSPATQEQVMERSEISFLFAISEFAFDHSVNIAPDRDMWGNMLPPGPEARAQWITDAEARPVFRYRRWGQNWENQDITQAVGYYWFRTDENTFGAIVGTDGTGNLTGVNPEPYSMRSVCYLTKHMPILVAETDASLGLAHMPRRCGCEPDHDPQDPGFRPWRALYFEPEGPVPGLSVLRPDVVGRRYAIGQNPAWIPALLPEAFRDTFASSLSQGLTGDIATIIGLMALHSSRTRPYEIFENHAWMNNEWHGPATAPWHVPKPQVDTFPRGFLVHVSLDNLHNPRLSTREMMKILESSTPMVKG